MKKVRSSFVCQECGYDSPSWLGKCPECGTWNSLKEFTHQKIVPGTVPSSIVVAKQLSQISSSQKNRVSTGFLEMDGVLGGGIVPGSVLLIAGDPGVGKSTLLLQMALNMSVDKNGGKVVLYLSGEESEEQIKIRAERLLKNKRIDNSDNNFMLASTTNIEQVISLIEEKKPDLIIIDSIQTMESSVVGGLSGSVAQIRYTTSQLIKTAKTMQIPLFIVGHVTKEGMVAGPMMLTHMVDCVLFLEGEKASKNRILRSFKNRFGPVDEVGIFAMEEDGLFEATDPEHLFLSEENVRASGSTLTVVLEGTRAFVVEVQALVVSTKLPMPRHVALGVDTKRLEILLAVLQKHGNIPSGTLDVFVSVAGGMKITDPGADLAILLAIVSSYKGIVLSDTVAISEVGLLGELRGVTLLDKRIKEAKKLGFTKFYTKKEYKKITDVIQSLR